MNQMENSQTLTERDLSSLIEAALWSSIDNGPNTPEFERLAEQLENATPIDQSSWMTSSEGIALELADGSTFLVTVQKVR